MLRNLHTILYHREIFFRYTKPLSSLFVKQQDVGLMRRYLTDLYFSMEKAALSLKVLLIHVTLFHSTTTVPEWLERWSGIHLYMITNTARSMTTLSTQKEIKRGVFLVRLRPPRC